MENDNDYGVSNPSNSDSIPDSEGDRVPVQNPTSTYASGGNNGVHIRLHTLVDANGNRSQEFYGGGGGGASMSHEDTVANGAPSIGGSGRFTPISPWVSGGGSSDDEARLHGGGYPVTYSDAGTRAKQLEDALAEVEHYKQALEYAVNWQAREVRTLVHQKLHDVEGYEVIKRNRLQLDVLKAFQLKTKE